MLESCARFQTMSAGELAGILTGYVTKVRAVLIDTETPLSARLAEIERYTDTVVAPPPGAGTGRGLMLAVTRLPVPAA